jgi:hypothetical protein
MKEKPRPDFDDEFHRYCMNRQGAIQALCVKPSYFDMHIRPRLRTAKKGTSLLFLCEEVKAIAYEMFNAPGTELARADDMQTQPEKTSATPWEKNQPASTNGKTATGSSINSSSAFGFTKALNRMKTQKRGSPGN